VRVLRSKRMMHFSFTLTIRSSRPWKRSFHSSLRKKSS